MPENSDAYAFCHCPFQGGQNGANTSRPDSPEAGQGCALPYHAKMCSETAQVSTEQLIGGFEQVSQASGSERILRDRHSLQRRVFRSACVQKGIVVLAQVRRFQTSRTAFAVMPNCVARLAASVPRTSRFALAR